MLDDRASSFRAVTGAGGKISPPARTNPYPAIRSVLTIYFNSAWRILGVEAAWVSRAYILYSLGCHAIQVESVRDFVAKMLKGAVDPGHTLYMSIQLCLVAPVLAARLPKPAVGADPVEPKGQWAGA